MANKKGTKPKPITKKSTSSDFAEMIVEALRNLKQKNGSSKEEIIAYVFAYFTTYDFTIAANQNKARRPLSLALQSCITNGTVEKVRGSGKKETFKLTLSTATTKADKELPQKTRKEDKNKKKHKLSKSSSVPDKDLTSPETTKKSSGAKRSRSFKAKSNKLKTDIRTVNTDSYTSASVTCPSTSSETTSIASEADSGLSLNDIKAERVRSIHVKLPTDKSDCHICSMDITPDGRMLLADFTNQCIKLFDKEGEYATRYVFPKKFQNVEIAVIDNDECILSLYNERNLQVLSIKDNALAIKGTIKLKETIRGISYCQDRIVVLGLKIGMVKVINRQGKTYCGRSTWRAGDKPNDWIARCSTCFVENGNLAVIVSGTLYNKIIKLDGNTGDVMKSFDVVGMGQSSLSRDERGLIYLCNNLSREVHVYSADLECCKVLLSNNQKLCNMPISVKYNVSNRQLYVANNCLNTVNYVDCDYFNNCNYIEAYQLQ